MLNDISQTVTSTLTTNVVDQKTEDIVDDIIKILNQEKVTIDDFNRIIKSLMKRKNNAYLHFDDVDSCKLTECRDIGITIEHDKPIVQELEHKVWLAWYIFLIKEGYK